MATAAGLAGLAATAAHAASPINTAQPYYLQSDVGTTVLPDFQGGTLRDDQNNVTDGHAYTVENYPTNTIDAFGHTTTFAGSFSGAGPLTITDSAGVLVGDVIFSGTSTLGGTVTIGTDARMQWGDGAPAYLVGPGNAIVDNGSLWMNFGSGGISGAFAISGPGNIEMYGGTLTESGAATLTGPIYIGTGATLKLVGAGSIANSQLLFVAGTFDISGASGDVSLQRLDGSTSVILGSNTLVLTNSQGDDFAGVISGSGGVTITTGTMYLLGANTYTGPTTVDPGATLGIGQGTPDASMASNIIDNGALIFDLTTALTYGQAISGSGSVTVNGAGPITLTADETYTGPTSIAAGSSLQLGSGGSTGSLASTSIDDEGLLIFDRSAALTWAGTVQGAGAVTIAGSGPITFTGDNTYAGMTNVRSGATLNLGAGGTSGSLAGPIGVDGVLDFNRSDTLVLSQSIFGLGALNQVGTGTTVLDAANPFEGLTTITAGALEVGDAGHAGATLGGDVVVGAGGTLMGHGTIAGSVTNNGVVAPGGTIGTLTVGSYAQGAGGVLAIEVSPTAASQLNSLGAASLNGKLALTFDPGTYGANIYTIVAGHPVTGTFSSVTGLGSLGPGNVSAILYGPTAVELVTEATAGAQVYGGLSAATLDRAENLVSLVEDRFGDAACPDGSRKTPAGCGGYGVWAFALGSWNHQGADGGGFGFRNDGAGFVGGLDRSAPNGSRAGVAFGYVHNDLTMDAVEAKAAGPSYYGAVYGRLVDGDAWFDGEAFYMQTDWSVARTLPGYGTANAAPNAPSAGFLLQASAPIGDSGLRPYARFTYVHSSRDAATELGVGPLDFQIDSAGQTAAIGEVGLRYEGVFKTTSGAALRPAIQLGVQDNFGDRHQTVSGALAGLSDTAFDQAGPRLWGVAAVVDGSLKVQVSKSLELFGDLRGRFADRQTDGVASAGGVIRF